MCNCIIESNWGISGTKTKKLSSTSIDCVVQFNGVSDDLFGVHESSASRNLFT